MSFKTRVGVQTSRTVSIFAALSMFVALIPVFLAPLPARGAHSGDPLDSTSSSTSNPDLSGSCGLDILFVLDETGS